MMCPAIANSRVVANDECDRPRWVNARRARQPVPRRTVCRDTLRNFHWSARRRMARCANFSGSAWGKSVRWIGEYTGHTSGNRTSLPCRFSPQAGRSAPVLLWKWNFLKSVSLLLIYCHRESFLTAGIRTGREASRAPPPRGIYDVATQSHLRFAAFTLGFD